MEERNDEWFTTDLSWTSDGNTTSDNRLALYRIVNGSTYFDRDEIIFYVYYYGLLFMLSCVNLIGNGLVIYCVLRQRKLLVPANYFVVSLACSDLILGIVYPIYNVSHMEAVAIENTLGEWGSCTVIITLTLGMLNVSSYNLVGVTVTRFISIKDPLKFMRRMTHGRTVTAVALVWILLMALACGLYLRDSPPDEYSSCRYEKVLNSQPLHIFFTCIFSMIIPLVIMILLYSYMAVIARKQARAIFTQGRRTSADALHGRMLRHELKMFRVAGTLLGYFTFAWAPFVIFEFITIVEQNTLSRYIRATVRVILHSNSAVNAFIYAGRLNEFREAMRKEASCPPCQRKCRPASVDLSSRAGGDLTRRNSSYISRSSTNDARRLRTSNQKEFDSRRLRTSNQKEFDSRKESAERKSRTRSRTLLTCSRKISNDSNAGPDKGRDEPVQTVS